MKVQNIEVCYHKDVILKNINFEINQGEIYGIIGKNGAGKTTLMKAMINAIKVSKGSIERQPGEKMGSLIEVPGLFLDMTGFDNLYMKVLAEGGKKSEAKKLLSIVGLGEAENKKVKTYSLGMRQRLGIAMALIGDPQVIVLDEPINGLDPKGIKEMRELFVELKEKYNKTIVISSHILEELEKVCDKFLFINKGEAIKFLTSSELDQELRECITVTVAETDKLDSIMRKSEVSNYSIERNHVKIFDRNIDVSNLIEELVYAKIKILEVYKKNISCEEYFLNLIG